jgi:hypothetical protein
MYKEKTISCIEPLVEKTDLSHKWKGIKSLPGIWKTFGLKT